MVRIANDSAAERIAAAFLCHRPDLGNSGGSSRGSGKTRWGIRGTAHCIPAAAEAAAALAPIACCMGTVDADDVVVLVAAGRMSRVRTSSLQWCVDLRPAVAGSFLLEERKQSATRIGPRTRSQLGTAHVASIGGAAAVKRTLWEK